MVLLSVFMLAGCSTKFTYKNFDWLIYWYLDDYIEFTDKQEAAFDKHLHNWLIWHKSTEMPKYLAHLDEVIADLGSQQMSFERILYHQHKARAHWERIRAHISSDLVDMAMSLNDKQVDEFFIALAEKLEEEQEELADELAKTASRQQNNWFKAFKDDASDWIGRLNDEQKQFVKNSYSSFLPSRQLWLDYYKDYQAVLKQAFLGRQNEVVFKAELYELINNPEQYRSEALVDVFEKNAHAKVSMLLTVLTLSSEKQQTKLVKEIGEYRQDVIDLIEWEVK